MKIAYLLILVFNFTYLAAQTDAFIIDWLEYENVKNKKRVDSLLIENTKLKIQNETNLKSIEQLKKQLKEYQELYADIQRSHGELKSKIDRTMNDHLRSSIKFFAILNNKKKENVELSEYTNIKGKKIQAFRVVAKGSLSDTDNRKLKVEILKVGDVEIIGFREGIIEKGEVNFSITFSSLIKIKKGTYLFIVKVNEDEIYRSNFTFD